MGKTPPEIRVIVHGPDPLAEFVKREVATALANIGAFDVTAAGELRNDDGTSQDPRRMKALHDLARQGVAIYVDVDE